MPMKIMPPATTGLCQWIPLPSLATHFTFRAVVRSKFAVLVEGRPGLKLSGSPLLDEYIFRPGSLPPHCGQSSATRQRLEPTTAKIESSLRALFLGEESETFGMKEERFTRL